MQFLSFFFFLRQRCSGLGRRTSLVNYTYWRTWTRSNSALWSWVHRHSFSSAPAQLVTGPMPGLFGQWQLGLKKTNKQTFFNHMFLCRLSDDNSLVVWINIEDHLKLVTTRHDADVAEAFKFIFAKLQKVLQIQTTCTIYQRMLNRYQLIDVIPVLASWGWSTASWDTLLSGSSSWAGWAALPLK